MSNDQFDGKTQGGIEGEDEAEDIIQYDCGEAICYARNPIIPHPNRPNSWLEKDFLVYTPNHHLFCIEIKNFRGRISYPKLPQTSCQDSGEALHALHYDYAHLIQEKPDKIRIMDNPLDNTMRYITHLKKHLLTIDPQLPELSIMPIVAFSTKCDISAIHDNYRGFLYITELPAFFQYFPGPICEPALQITQVIKKITCWDRIRLRGSNQWANGHLVGPDFIFWEPNGRVHHIPFAQINVVAVNRNGPSYLTMTITIRYIDNIEVTFRLASGQIKHTYRGQSRTYTLQTIDRIIVGTANKFH